MRRTHPAPSVVATMALLLVLTACKVGSTTSPSASVGPEASTPVSAAAGCAPIDLRSPSGVRVDLTGTWRGGQNVHYVRQDGSCVWWISLSDFPGQEVGAQVMAMFRGELSSDFTLRGEWMSVVRPPAISDPRRGIVVFEIEFETGAGSESLVLHGTSQAGPYQADTLTYVGPLPASAPI
jgi:hypothetical protein